jgi:large subunit ribosomal protein L35
MPDRSKGRQLSTLVGKMPLLLETEMPKMKTKSSAKKRFKITKSGKVKAGQAGKQHGMIKRTNDQIRKLRGTTVLANCDAKVIKKKYIPDGESPPYPNTGELSWHESNAA